VGRYRHIFDRRRQVRDLSAPDVSKAIPSAVTIFSSPLASEFVDLFCTDLPEAGGRYNHRAERDSHDVR